MKFAVERDALLRALDHAQRIVLHKDQIAVLNTVRVEATDGHVLVTASNLDMMAETGCPADVAERGIGCIPLDPLFKLLQRLPAGSAMTLDGTKAPERVEIRCRRSVIELPMLPDGDFPKLPTVAGASEAEIDGAALARLLEAPAHIADATSPYTFGVGVHLFRPPGGDHLCSIATNGKRATRVLLPMVDGADELPPVTLALKPLAEIVKLARSAKGPVRLRVTEYWLSAYAADVTITTKLVDARFPDLGVYFQAPFDGAARVVSAELDAALSRALIVADEKYRNIHCYVEGGSLSIRSRASDATSARGAVSEDVDAEGGDGLGFSVNTAWLREALSAVDADTVELVQSGAGQPIVLRATGGGPVTALLMPTLG